MVQMSGVRKVFPVRGGSWPFGHSWSVAIDGVDLAIERGEVFGIVGQSGSGKTTLGRLIALLDRPTAGTISYDGRDLSTIRGRARKAFHRRVQMVNQNPFDALDPRLRIRDSLLEPLRIQGIGGRAERTEAVSNVLAQVGLAADLLDLYPHSLSGGQRQRVVIARALLLHPDLIVADEPVSMLDVSVRATILRLLLDLKAGTSMTYVYITHDLSTARYLCDRVAVMHSGRFVELGPTDEVIRAPKDPYTRALIDAVPRLDRRPSVRREDIDARRHT